MTSESPPQDGHVAAEPKPGGANHDLSHAEQAVGMWEAVGTKKRGYGGVRSIKSWDLVGVAEATGGAERGRRHRGVAAFPPSPAH